MRECRRCGSALQEGARWCALCLGRVIDVDDSELVQALQESLHPRTGWLSPWIHREPVPPKEFSRWREGPLSFGPATKVVLTVLVGMFLTNGVRAAGANVFNLIMVPLYFVFTGFALWHIWRKERVR